MMQRNCSLRPDVGTIVPWPDHLPARFSIGSGAGGGGAIAGLRTAGTGTGTTSAVVACVSPALAGCGAPPISNRQSANAGTVLAHLPSMKDSLTKTIDVPAPGPM